MHSKYLALLSVCLAANALAIRDTIEQIENSDAYKKLVDSLNATDNMFHHPVNETKSKFDEHKHKHVQTLQITKSKGGPTMTVVTVPGGPAVTLDAHGERTTFAGHTYTVVPATFIHPSPHHPHASSHSAAHSSSATHAPASSPHPSAHVTSATHASSSTTTVHVVKTTVKSGKTKATLVSVSGGPVVTLAAKGSTTVIGGATYTVKPAATSSVSHSTSSTSHSSATSHSASASAVSVADASASASHKPNAAPATYAPGSFAGTVAGSVLALGGVSFGAFLVL